MEHISLSVVWFLQFAGTVTVAIALPKAQWRFKVLFGLSALADLVEAPLYGWSNAYFYAYWYLRMLELLWLLYATCEFSISVLHSSLRQLIWVMFMTGILSSIAVNPPRTNDGMQVWQVFMLMLAALVALGTYSLMHGLRWATISLAAGLAAALQLACTLLWRHWRYDSHMWMVAWLSGMALLWAASRSEHRASAAHAANGS